MTDKTNHSGRLEILGVTQQFNVSGRYFTALEDITLTVEPGEFVVLVGASGCGKSTLLRAIVGLEDRYSGQILLDGKRLGPPTLGRAIVFQEHRLFPWLTALQNVELGLQKSGLSAATRRDRAREHLALVGLTEFEDALPAQLSGGMSQRVAIARALAPRPPVLLLDEPFGALDAMTRGHLQEELRRIVDAEKITAILVTHDVEEAVTLADRVVVMQPHPGRIREIVQIPPGEGADRTSDTFVALRRQILAALDHDIPGRAEDQAQPYLQNTLTAAE
ncbi:ABC transporter ATP-binding protein [Gemmobacter sp. 24YEA27]|uniref:ABC transporter ATP-binding protein n=1 Tax=Gemmobacter sp. 24YEA27 TaxID=3040672 RepID=UPI0024B3B85A|nr:ABC transporter ATP-binding protein [Gemmobacter sp. 24YEA27]